MHDSGVPGVFLHIHDKRTYRRDFVSICTDWNKLERTGAYINYTVIAHQPEALHQLIGPPPPGLDSFLSRSSLRRL